MITEESLVIDASTLLNLAASCLIRDLLAAVSPKLCLVCRIVREECLFIRSADGRQKQALDVGELIADGVLSECTLSEAEEERFVTHAAVIGDGEAMSLAVAECRAHPLLTDDRKALRLAAKFNVRTIRTSEILRELAKSRDPREIAAAIAAIEMRARFRPPDDDPNYEWWIAFLQDAE